MSRAPTKTDARRRLELEAREALAGATGNFEAAMDAFATAIKADAELLWELFTPVRHVVMRDLLGDVAQAIREAERRSHGLADTQRISASSHSRPGGHFVSDTHELTAAGPRSSSASQVNTAAHVTSAQSDDRPGGHRRADTRVEVAARPPLLSSRHTGGLAGAAQVAKALVLERATDLGKPLGDCTAAELRALERRSLRDAWFYKAIVAQLPEKGVVRDYLTETDAAALWASSDRANSAGAAP